VYMDAINRRIAWQTLLEFAREKDHLQFIFLTPQVRLLALHCSVLLCNSDGPPLVLLLGCVVGRSANAYHSLVEWPGTTACGPRTLCSSRAQISSACCL
jgi:hypothetical protein